MKYAGIPLLIVEKLMLTVPVYNLKYSNRTVTQTARNPSCLLYMGIAMQYTDVRSCIYLLHQQWELLPSFSNIMIHASLLIT